MSERVGGRVTRQYFGKGPNAALAANLLEVARHRRETQRAAVTAYRDLFEDLDKTLDDLNFLADRAAAATLEAAGYHRHNRGTWRKRREQ